MTDVSVAILHERSRYQKGEQGNLCPQGLMERVRIEWDVCAQNRLLLWLRGARLSLLTVFGEAALSPCTTHQPWRIPWTGEPGGLQSMGSLESDATGRLHYHFSLSCTGEGGGGPLQCSCLENSGDGGAWWAAICGRDHVVFPSSLEIMLPGTPKNGSFPATPGDLGLEQGCLSY